MNHLPGDVLIRLSPEITIKMRGTRRRFQRRLAGNLADALERLDWPFEVDFGWSRLFARSSSPDALETLSRVAGVASLSVLEGVCPPDLDSIVERGLGLYAERIRGRTFGVRARSSGSHRLSVRELERELGSALNPGATVNLTDPDVWVRIEVRSEAAYLFSSRVEGRGGLPAGCGGRAVCLLSGGFDSAVAAWMMLRRGVELDYLFCRLGAGSEERTVAAIARVLAERWSHGYRPRLHVLDFREVVAAIQATAHPSYWQVILKREMLRAAARLSQRERGSAVVTGECLGQVSSQTLRNLGVIERAVSTPILRPLIGFNKNRIIELSKEVGSHDLSATVQEHCAITPSKPVTAATLTATEREEEGVGPTPLATALARGRVIDLLASEDGGWDDIFADRIPPGAVLIDVREEPEFASWHHPGAVRMDFSRLLEEGDGLDPAATYLVYCDRSVRSAHAAERLRRRGLKAFAFRGSAIKLRALAA